MMQASSDSISPLGEHAHGWLDKLAMSMAVVCAIHCLVTPVALVALPILATTFWVDESFHLWMLFLVIPTTGLSVMMGCRKHKDRWVMGLAASGITLLFAALLIGHPGLFAFLSQDGAHAHAACCVHHGESGSGAYLTAESAITSVGGFLLIAGHYRNFRLCRHSRCEHR